MVTSGGEAVVREVRIAAKPEIVFDFFTDPAKMAQWKGMSCMLDARPGGIYRCDLNGHNVIRGEYIEVLPYTRIVFSFGWEGENPLVPPGGSTVEVTFLAEGEGAVVRLRHTGLVGEAAQEHAQGWDHFLARLVIAAGGGDPGPDPWAQPEPSSSA